MSQDLIETAILNNLQMESEKLQLLQQQEYEHGVGGDHCLEGAHGMAGTQGHGSSCSTDVYDTSEQDKQQTAPDHLFGHSADGAHNVGGA